MGLKCRIAYDKANKATVYNEDGTISTLYQDLLNHFEGDQTQAIEAWAVTQSDDFFDSYPEKTLEVQDVLRYIDTVSSEDIQLTPKQVREVTEMMNATGFTYLEDFYTQLVRIFKPNGTIEFNQQEALSSGLYNEQNISNIDLDVVSDLMVAIEGQMRLYDITIEPNTTEYTDTSRVTTIGVHPKVTIEKLNEDLRNLVGKTQSEEEFLQEVDKLPYPDLAERLRLDDDFYNETVEKLQELNVIPQVFFEGETLTDEDLSFETTLKNIVPVGTNTAEIEAKIRFLEETSPVGWESTRMEGVLKDVAKTLTEYNVDIVGLENLQSQPLDVIQLISVAKSMLDNPTDSNIKRFAELKQRLLPDVTLPRVESLPEAYKDLSVVSLRTTLSDQQLLEKGLIKIGEDLYHKVQLAERDTLYENIYQKYINGELRIPNKFRTIKGAQVKDLSNKVKVLQDLEVFINSRETGLRLRDNELLSLHQVAFGHIPIPTKTQVEQIQKAAPILTDTNYLTEEFVSDFYNYILREKAEDSEVYRNVLSKFSVTPKGLTLVGEVESVRGIELQSELEDYIRLRRDSSMDHLLEQGVSTQANSDVLAINFPETVKEYTKEAVQKEEFMVTGSNNSDYIRVADRLYKKVLDDTQKAVYTEVQPNLNPTYLSNFTGVEYNHGLAVEAMESTNIVQEVPTLSQTNQTLTDAGYNNRHTPEGGLPTLRKSVQQAWVSTALKGLSLVIQETATPEQWVKQIADKGGKGTTQELEWIGLQDYLNEWKKENNAKSIPKEVVEQYINDNQIEIVEVGKGRSTPKLVFDTDVEGRWQAEDPTGTFSGDYTIQWLRNESKFELESADGFISLHNSFEEAADRANEHISSNQVGEVEGQTRYSQYQLEGGENYREVLLTLPSRETLSFEEWAEQEYGDVLDLTENQLRLAKKQYENAKEDLRRGTEKGYISSHWDETNILAHLRLNERTLPNGERVLFIEEVQSDFSQQIKKEQDDILNSISDSYIDKLISNGIVKEEC